MIINLRGTSGSGKSYLAKKLMACYQQREPVFVPNRKRPWGYCCHRNDGAGLYVVGHYDMPCGGGDTIQGLDRIYESVTAAADTGQDVLYEGLIIQSDIRRAVELSKRHPLLVVIIDEPLEVCLAAIEGRRRARGDARPLNPRNTISKMETIPRQAERLKEGGVDVRRLNRADALAACLEALKLQDQTDGRCEDVFQLR